MLPIGYVPQHLNSHISSKLRSDVEAWLLPGMQTNDATMVWSVIIVASQLTAKQIIIGGLKRSGTSQISYREVQIILAQNKSLGCFLRPV